MRRESLRRGGLKASYTPEGAAWLDQLRGYIAENYAFTRDYLRSQLPQCPMARLEATYLPWVDIKGLGIDSETLEQRLVNEAKVWVNCGDMYGTGGYLRINIACPRHMLAEGLRRMTDWINRNCRTA